MSSELPRPLGPYLLLRHLASGGMGEVYLATAEERVCVVKTIRPEIALDDIMLTRFLDEARTSAFLTHRNIAEVFDVGRVDNLAYMAVEHVAGRDLQSVLRRTKRERATIPLDVATHIVCQLLEGLAYVHQATHPRTHEPLHIVHRDISPHNVMVAFTGEVKIIDFGIARSAVKKDVTQAGQAVGKIRYMAPEQARAESVDASADIWAASLVATEVFTQKRFWGDLPLETILLRVATGVPPKSEALAALPDALRKAIQKGLDLDAKKRPSAQQLKERILDAAGVRASREATRTLMRTLFVGEEEEEQRVHARLLQEPTTVHAEAIWSHTATEETPPDGTGAVDMDAPTASRLLVPDGSVESTSAEASSTSDIHDDLRAELEADDAIVESRPSMKNARARVVRVDTSGAPPSRSTSRFTPRSRLAPAAMVAGVFLAASALATTGIILVGRAAPPSEEAPLRPRIEPVNVDVPPPDIPPDPTPTPTPAVVPPTPPVVATPPPAPPAATPAAAAPKETHHARHVAAAPKEPKEAMSPIEAIKALKACPRPPECEANVLHRATTDLRNMSVAETDAFTKEVQWCLGQCK